jgi:hypothetical protein
MLTFLMKRKWTLVAGFFAAKYLYNRWQEQSQEHSKELPEKPEKLTAPMREIASHH